MYVTLIMVSSVNGKITHNNTISRSNWSSIEDTMLLNDIKKQHNLIVMGRKTYIANKEQIRLQNNILRVVFTRNPEKYRENEITDQLEFVNIAPKKLITRLESRGYAKMLLVGGSEINSLFFRDKLIDELHLTIEPYLFGKGINLLTEINFDVQLHCKSVEKLNTNGTLHVIYTIQKS